MVYIMSTFANWLEAEMARRGWSQAELGRRAGVPRGTINNIVMNSRNPGVDVCKAIAKALDLPDITVLRKAGILKKVPKRDEQIEKWDHIFNQAEDEDERRRLMEVAQFELERIIREKKSDYK